MLVGFGVSWPFAVWKTYTSKSVKGKSILFLWFVFLGYASGVLHKVFYNPDPVVVLYVFNGILVGTDILLYYRYSGREAPAPAGGTQPGSA
jgi:hypothetical protein